MSGNTRQNWVQGRPDLAFPKSGLLAETVDSLVCGALGFRPSTDGCDLWHETGSNKADWAILVERVTAQARKAKYRRAVVTTSEPMTQELECALLEAGFTGQPLSRDLVFDASGDLQPYLDWKGRVTRVAEGKGSEAINAGLFEIVAEGFPAEGRYSEVEVNAILNGLHLYKDHATLRRELVDRGHIGRTRDCREYWKISPTVDGTE